MEEYAAEHVDVMSRKIEDQKKEFQLALRDEARQRAALEARLDILSTRFGELARTARSDSVIDLKTPQSFSGAGSERGVGPRLYVMGGYSGTSCLRTADYYDVNEAKWVSIPSMPRPRAFGGAAALGGRAFLFGGLELSYVSTALCFNPVTNTWTSIAAMNSARVMCAGVTCGGKIYAIGGEGTDNKAVNTVEIYDPLTNTWTTAAPMLTPRTHMATTTLGGLIYVFGGRSTGSNMDVLPPSAECYDPATGRWKVLAPPLSRRSGGAAVVVDNKILVCGGDTVTADMQSVMVASIEQYDPVADVWSTCPWALSTPRSQIAVHCVTTPMSSAAGAAASSGGASSSGAGAGASGAGGANGNGAAGLASGVGASLFVLGGWEGKDVATAEMLNLSTNVWSPLAPLPSVNRGFATVIMS